MTLRGKLEELMNAGFSGIWIQSVEHDAAELVVAQIAKARGCLAASWNADRGLGEIGSMDGDGSEDPTPSVKSLGRATKMVLVFRNLHRFFRGDGGTELIASLDLAIMNAKANSAFLVVVSHTVDQIPAELQKHFVIVEHSLPNVEELGEALDGVAAEPGDVPDGLRPSILAAAAGLTRFEAEGAFALSLARFGKVRPEVVWEIKAGMLKKAGTLSLYQGKEGFESLGGLKALKAFSKRALLTAHATARPRGLLLLGVPGGGKSAMAKALGNETGRPTVVLDIGSLMGSLVGQTEENTRRALAIVDAMAPCILFIDELEKALSGVTSGGGDSGVSSRMFGAFLTWLSDHTTDVMVVCTSNDISKLPPEFSRAERFDGIFFVDLPDKEQKEIIWALYEKEFSVTGQRPVDNDWTGAEIKACCRLAAMLGVSLVEASQNVVPVMKTASEKIQALRAWASQRCLSSEYPGVYTQQAVADKAATPKGNRSVQRGRDASSN